MLSDPLVPDNIDGCSLQKSDTIIVLYGSLDCNIPSSNIVVVYCVYDTPCGRSLSLVVTSLELMLVEDWIDILL